MVAGLVMALLPATPAASAGNQGRVVSNYPGISGPIEIAAGPDGALWFTNIGNDSIGRISTAGVVTNYAGTGISYPFGIAAGSDGTLWFTNFAGSIGRITTPPYARISPTSGSPGALVKVKGGGFSSGERVAFDYETGLASPTKVLLCQTTATVDGTAGCSGTIPAGTDAGALGAHEVVAEGQTSLTKAKVTFTLTS